jgi:hypothetical protein
MPCNYVLAALLVSPALLAQSISFGVRVGTPTTNLFRVDASRGTSTRRFTVGPTIGINFWRGAAIEADFLLTAATLATAGSSATIRRWELPITVVYNFRPSRVGSFVRAGLALNRVFDTGAAVECGRGIFGEQFYCLNGSSLAELRHRGTFGPVIGGGLHFRVKGIRLETEARLTRWVDRNFGVRDSAVQSNLTQVEILVGAML